MNNGSPTSFGKGAPRGKVREGQIKDESQVP